MIKHAVFMVGPTFNNLTGYPGLFGYNVWRLFQWRCSQLLTKNS